MSVRLRNIGIGLGALTIGAMLYILFRDETFFSNAFAHNQVVISIRSWVEPFACGFLQFYLADYLWCLSLFCWLFAVYLPGIKGGKLCMCIAIACGCVWELMQYVGVVNGTGDWLDVLMYLLAGITGYRINRRNLYEKG